MDPQNYDNFVNVLYEYFINLARASVQICNMETELIDKIEIVNEVGLDMNIEFVLRMLKENVKN